MRWLIVFQAAMLLLQLAGNAEASHRRALLIGWSEYQNVEKNLVNPPVDVALMEKSLGSAGYIISKIGDESSTYKAFLEKWENFLDTIDVGDEVVVFYAGHGLDINGANYLVPSDAPKVRSTSKEEVYIKSLMNLRELVGHVANRQPLMQVWIIDACRLNPFSGSGRPFVQSAGLAKELLSPGQGNSFFLFSADYGQPAEDTLPGESASEGKGSPFSRVFAKAFEQYKSRSIIDLFSPPRGGEAFSAAKESNSTTECRNGEALVLRGVSDQRYESGANVRTGGLDKGDCQCNCEFEESFG
jgi:hypothetical protein